MQRSRCICATLCLGFCLGFGSCKPKEVSPPVWTRVKSAPVVLDAENINKKDEHGRTRLLNAMGKGREQEALMLLQIEGVDVNACAPEGCAPLWLAAREGMHGICGRLVRMGADVNHQDDFGSVALHVAVQERKADIVELLIGCHADVNIPNNNGTTPLFLAVALERQEIAERLLKAGADWRVGNRRGDTALSVAKQTGQTNVVALIEALQVRHGPANGSTNGTLLLEESTNSAGAK